MTPRSVVAVGAVLRLLATVGVQPTVYVDSIEYRGVAFFGGRRRPWTVPLLYALVGDGTARVVAHAVLGAAAWAALALALAEVLRHPRLRLGVVAVVMTLGLVGPVANYDATILSETVAVSLTVALLAVWIRFVASPSLARAAALVAVAVPFTFTRNDHPLLLGATALVAAYVGIRRNEVVWRVLAAALVVVASWGWLAAERDDSAERHNLALVMGNRLAQESGALGWFVDRGMPLPESLGTTDAVVAFDEDPAWNEWASDSGRTDYAFWLATHPRQLLLEPWPDLFGLRDTSLEDQREQLVLLAPGDRYGRMHTVVPEAVEQVVWGGTSAAPVLVAGGWLLVAALRRRDGLLARLGPLRTIGVVALVLGLGHALLTWHASTLEIGRHAVVAATTIHVALVLLVAVTLDRRLVPVGLDPAEGAERPDAYDRAPDDV